MSSPCQALPIESRIGSIGFKRKVTAVRSDMCPVPTHACVHAWAGVAWGYWGSVPPLPVSGTGGVVVVGSVVVVVGGGRGGGRRLGGGGRSPWSSAPWSWSARSRSAPSGVTVGTGRDLVSEGLGRRRSSSSRLPRSRRAPGRARSPPRPGSRSIAFIAVLMPSRGGSGGIIGSPAARGCPGGGTSMRRVGSSCTGGRL